MVEIQEYGNEKKHLSDREALEQFTYERSAHPNDIVILKDLDCGHWQIDVYSTEQEKELLYQEKLSEMIQNILSVLLR